MYQNGCADMAEGVGFEPTDRLNTDQTISSRSRYDHFDSPPDITLYACLSDSICDYTECGAKNQGAEETFAEGWTIGAKACTMADAVSNGSPRRAAPSVTACAVPAPPEGEPSAGDS